MAQLEQPLSQDLYVASGVYQLPLFKGLPSMALLVEMKRSGDVEGTLFRALKVRTTVFRCLKVFCCGCVSVQHDSPSHPSPSMTSVVTFQDVGTCLAC